MHSYRSLRKDDECTNERWETQAFQLKKQAGFSHRGRPYEGQQCAIEGKREWLSTRERGRKKDPRSTHSDSSQQSQNPNCFGQFSGRS